MKNKEIILALATRATPGPWVCDDPPGKGACIKNPYTQEWVALTCGDSQETSECNARYITSISPDVLLQLLHEREEVLHLLRIQTQVILAHLITPSEETERKLSKAVCNSIERLDDYE